MLKWWLTFLLVLLGNGQVSVAGEIETLISKIRSGQAELQKQEANTKAVQAERDFKIRGETEKSTYVTFQHNGSILVLWENRRFCLTTDEAFGVEKPPTSDKYAILFQTTNKPEEFFFKHVGKNHLLFRPLTAAVQSSTVLNVLDREGFKGESITQDGADLVTLHYTHPLPGRGAGEVNRGAMTFSVPNHYLLTRFDYVLPVKNGENTRQLHGVMSRKFSIQGGQPVVTEVSQSLTSIPADLGDNTTRVRYTYPAQGASPDEFRLTHYTSSLPPAQDVYEDRPPFNWPLWGGIGVGCIALSILLAWLVRRNRRAT